MKKHKETVLEVAINFQEIKLYLETIIQEQKQVSGSDSKNSYILAS